MNISHQETWVFLANIAKVLLALLQSIVDTFYVLV